MYYMAYTLITDVFSSYRENCTTTTQTLRQFNLKSLLKINLYLINYFFIPFFVKKIVFLWCPVNFETAYAAQKLIDRISFLRGNSAEEF